jgi:hypothetical protein
VADRVRVAASRKRGGAKRPVKKTRRPRSRRLGTLALVVLAVMILGFLTRRVMLPSAVHYLAHRPADSPATTTDGGTASNPSANQNGGADSEHLTTRDRDELNAIIKQKGK